MKQMKLLRRIASESLRVYAGNSRGAVDAGAAIQTFFDLLPRCTLIDGTDAASKFYSEETRQVVAGFEEIWPCGKFVWLECQTGELLSGAVLETIDLSEGKPRPMGNGSEPAFRLFEGNLDNPEAIRWQVHALIAVARPGLAPCLIGAVTYFVTKNGLLFSDDAVVTYFSTEAAHASMGVHTNGIVLSLWNAIGMLSHKNIGLAPSNLDALDQKRTTKRLRPREGGYKFSVIQLKAGKPGSQHRPGTANDGESFMPLGRVIAHTAKYGDRYNRGKLFGKYEGKFYIPEHTRGDERNGVRDHAYVIRADPPAEGATRASATPSDANAVSHNSPLM